MVYKNEHTRTDETTKDRIRIGAVMMGQTQGEFVEAAVAEYLRGHKMWQPVETARSRMDGRRK